LTTNSVARALAISLAAHLLFFGVLELTYLLKVHLPEWLKTAFDLAAASVEQKKNPPPVNQDVPLVFVEVDPSQARSESPKDTKNYSAFNSIAANPDVLLDTDKAKLDGTQTHVPKVADTLRPTPKPLQPAPSPQKPELKPENTQKPGDLALAKPADNPKKTEEPKPPRPRTILEAQLQKGVIPGPKLKQEGGVKRHGTISSFDAKGTEEGAYDAALITAVSKHWYDILDATTAPTRPGKVMIEFRLYPDGRVTELKIIESDVGDMLSLFCQKALSDPSPYAPWPSDMRRKYRNFRQLRFTFFYEF